MMEWVDSRKYFLLLLALILFFLVHPLLFGAYHGRLLYDGFLTLVFFTAFLVVFSEPRLRWLALLLGVPTVFANWAGTVFPSLPPIPLEVTLHVLASLFLSLSAATILQLIYRQETVTRDGVYGALCGYLLVGVVFGHLYCLVETIDPGSFRDPNAIPLQLQDGQLRQSELTYFSFVTLTTLGYGDITPGAPPARWLALVEAVLGQFYLAVLIAHLVGKRLAQAVSDSER